MFTLDGKIVRVFSKDFYDDVVHCDKIKILYRDGDGYCLLYKRIEHGKFHFPKKLLEDIYPVSHEELDWLMHGLSVEEMRHYNRQKNKTVSTENESFNMA